MKKETKEICKWGTMVVVVAMALYLIFIIIPDIMASGGSDNLMFYESFDNCQDCDEIKPCTENKPCTIKCRKEPLGIDERNGAGE